ncbi:neuronal acetylcholine receptor subunit alpha-6-like [Argopecten irradians]|uniref:neuronal acetylcholine receptor subunit alpha-6-like n=1 Tax=Argopecten irradians TaxID=31199 RepID=UPI003711A791
MLPVSINGDRIMFVCLVVILCSRPSLGQTTDIVLDFVNQTFCSSCPYSSNVFPRHDQSRPVEVDLSFSIAAITRFDEITGHLNMVGQLKMNWNDELVMDTLNKSYHTFKELCLPTDFVWTPTISIFNSVDNSVSTLGDSAHNVRIDMTSGDVEWTFGLVSKTGCSVDATKYPFDVQKCTLIFTPRGYIDTEIYFNVERSGIKLNEFTGNEEWNLTGTEVSTKVVNRQAFLSCEITLARKPTFFMINMALPIFLLAILNTLVFLLPAETGERVGYAIAAFLTFAVFLSLLSASLPQSSFPMPLLSYYMLIMLLLSSTITFVTVFNLRFHFVKTNLPVPKFLQTIVGRPCCNRSESNSLPKLVMESAVMDRRCDDKVVSCGTNGYRPGILGDHHDPTQTVNRKMIGKTLDKTFFIAYWFIYICVSLGFYIKVQQVSD